jgi:MoxR-like ATPase
VEATLIALFCEGNVLIEGGPGLGKTLLVNTLSKVLSCGFKRVQFTPDLMPSDLTGHSIYNIADQQFHFNAGPIFTNLLLADEINRAPAKTQSALLEAMQERQVTVDGRTYPLDRPFLTIATQNPLEQEGTYPLPEAQLDRFMFNLWLDYPSEIEEREIVKSTTSMYTPKLDHVLGKEEILFYQELVRRVPVADNVVAYAVNLVARTRPKSPLAPQFIRDWLSWGAGPRASQYLILGAKTHAILDGKHTPDIEDVRRAVGPVLRHRIVPNFNAEADGATAIQIVERLLAND